MSRGDRPATARLDAIGQITSGVARNFNSLLSVVLHQCTFSVA